MVHIQIFWEFSSDQQKDTEFEILQVKIYTMIEKGHFLLPD